MRNPTAHYIDLGRKPKWIWRLFVIASLACLIAASGCESTQVTPKQATYKPGVPQKEPQYILALRQKAEQGDPEAQYQLARQYDAGLGVYRNIEIAEKWYRLAAEQGHAEAQYSLGDLYHRGRGGITQSDAEAAKWYRRAAAQGHATAERRLCAGDLECMARIDREQARAAAQRIAVLTNAAEQGDADAQFKLAVRYEHGHEIKRDLDESLKWYRKAAGAGHAEANLALDRLYRSGEGVPSEPDKANEYRRKWAETRYGRLGITTTALPTEITVQRSSGLPASGSAGGGGGATGTPVDSALFGGALLGIIALPLAELAEMGEERAAKKLSEGLPKIDLRKLLEDKVHGVISANLDNLLTSTDPGQDPEGPDRYAGRGVDTVLELKVNQMGFSEVVTDRNNDGGPLGAVGREDSNNTEWEPYPSYRFTLNVVGTLVDAQTGRSLQSETVDHWGEARTRKDWLRNDAQAFRAAFRAGIDDVAPRLVGVLFEIPSLSDAAKPPNIKTQAKLQQRERQIIRD